VPSRGDFVQGGLPRDFVDPWYDWQSLVIAGSRDLMGDTWLDAFLEAPVWRFILPPGLCGPRPAVGLIMPSVDRVGRYFPLTFAALGAALPDAGTPDAGTPDAAAWSDWLDAAEALGRLALDEDATPEQLMPPPTPSAPFILAPATTGEPVCEWWTEGGPRVPATRLSLPTLPDAACFASMLGQIAPTESA
jgi:type VI secretion system protein ImpM